MTQQDNSGATNSTPHKRTQRSPKFVRVFVTIYIACIILFTFVATFCAQCLVYPFTRVFSSRANHIWIMGLLFRYISCLTTVINPFWSFTLHGSLPRRPKRLIIMCNHVSNLDPFITCRAILPWESKYIAKSDLFKVPFGGWAMSMSNDIPVFFTSEKGGWGTVKGSVGAMMVQCKWLVDNGIPIMVFPEGARSGGMTMREFKAGMFMFAKENNCDILPIALNNTHCAWSKSSALLDVADIHVKIGQVIKIDEQEKEEGVEKLMATVKGKIQALIDQLPNTKQ